MLKQMQLSRRLCRGLCLALTAFCTLSFALGSAAFAQSGPSGSLNGVVKDPSGAAISGAQVIASNAATGFNRTVAADAAGRWQIAVLPAGDYKITVVAEGFKKTVANISVEAAVNRTVEIKLEVGEVSIEVQITDAAALATPNTSTTFRQLTGNELVQVPTATRSFTHLLTAEAGVSADLSPVLTNGTGNISPSVNGTRTTSTSVTFNGVDATNISSNEGSLSDNISPAPETLQEVKLQTSLYDASTGRSGGGNFSLITKGGTNKLNGSIYHYLQNDALNANDFFYNKDSIKRPTARRNEGGFTVGGPVIKDKYFFFGGYQFTRAKTGFVPTASSQTVLPAALANINGEATPANVVTAFRALNPTLFNITEAQISPLVLKLMNLRNPATGGYFIQRPSTSAPLLRNAAGAVITDTTVAPWNGGNPLVRVRNVFPATFEQDQFTLRGDGQVTENNRVSATFFFANFPGFDPFPDPSSLASPVTLQRNDRNRTLALQDVHTFGVKLVNEARFGLFSLNNSRRLNDQFEAVTNQSVFGFTDAQLKAFNPSLNFDDSAATRRLGHYVFRNNLSNLSFGAPNDVYNQRKQTTYSFADNMTAILGAHTSRFGVEYKQHYYDSSLPEEQQTEFEKWENFTQFLTGLATEADTQFGVTTKNFKMRDLSFYFADDWRFKNNLTLNLGARWDWFGWPEEKNGRIGNFDFNSNTPLDNPTAGFIVPKNVKTTGLAAVDGAINATKKADNNHTLNGQDWNNIAPRFGFAFTPFGNNKVVVRGGYGIFYDRPSASFINTVFSNYPFLREIEVTAPTRLVPIGTAFSQQDTNFAFNGYLPNRVVYQANGSYVIRDGTAVTRQADGTNNPVDLATNAITRGNIAETFEFRAVDRNLRTPYVQQWNLGFQFEVGQNMLFEARYLGTKGTKLLQGVAFNQGYDFNDPRTPSIILKRFNDSYDAAYQAEFRRTGNANILRGALRNTADQRERGRGIAFGFQNPLLAGQGICANGVLNTTATTPVDYNISTPLTCTAANVAGGGTILPFEARGLYLGFNIPEALFLSSSANSVYHAAQFSLNRRMSKGLQYNLAYTMSKSIDNNSSDPGSTAGGGKPDVPNVGFVVQGDQRDLRSNRSVSDFDRTHRFSASFVYELPSFGKKSRALTGWQLSGFAQMQTGSPYSIFAAEPELQNGTQYTNLARGSGGIYRLGFGRPSLCGSLSDLRQQGADKTEAYFNQSVLCSSTTVAGGYPGNFGFGNLGRNVLRGDYQKRFDIGFNKNTAITERVALEFRWDIFNIFNNVNFATPNNDLQDATDFGKITNTIGGPRVMQFGMKLKF